MEEKLKSMQEHNNKLTREECVTLLKRLKEERLDPILALLYTKAGRSVTFVEIIGGYSAIEEGFKSQSRGAKDICAQVFYDFHPVSLFSDLCWHGDRKDLRTYFFGRLLHKVEHRTEREKKSCCVFHEVGRGNNFVIFCEGVRVKCH